MFLVPDLMAFGAEPGDGGVHVARPPEHDGVTEQAELILQAVAVRLVDGAACAVAHVPGEPVAGLLRGEPAVHPPAVGVVDRVDHPHQVFGPGDPPETRLWASGSSAPYVPVPTPGMVARRTAGRPGP